MTDDEANHDRAVTVVDERTAMLLWGGGNPLGRMVKDSNGTVREVIGVVATLKTRLVGSRFEYSAAFVPLPTAPSHRLTAVWRGPLTRGAREQLRREMARLEPSGQLSIREVRLTADQLGQPRFMAILLGALGMLAALLTFIGLYGVVSDITAKRTREIGIRVALGAARRSIAQLVVGQTLKPALLGVALGLALCVWWTETVRSLLHGIQPHDWRVFAAAALAMLAIVSFAAWLPARRASRIDPTIALRAE
jgi:predicted lysophospholipase L1 biosynthesis ABC-type transport system permease subunit